MAYNCAFERCGIIRAQSIEELFDVSMALAHQPLPKGNRVGVVTNAGGPGIMMTDALEMNDLKVAAIDEATKEKLRAFLPPAGSVHNPVDVLGDATPELFARAVEALLASDSIDSLIVLLTPQKVTDDEGTARLIVDISRKFSKPVFACFMGGNIIARGINLLRENHVPQYPVPERAAMALKEMVKYASYKARPLRLVERFAVNKIPVTKLFKSYQSRGRYEVGEVDSKAVMKAYNFILPPGMLVTSTAEALSFADQVGFPLAMKISSPDILHKSDVGGVKVNLRTPDDVEDAFDLMMLRIGRKKPDADIRGVFLEKMVAGGREVILGMKKDAQFGPLLMFGLGGIFVEVLKDVTFSLAPVTQEEALQMIERTKSYKLLRGSRGEEPVDIGAIVENIQRLSQLVTDFPEIEEIDLNPLMVGHEGDGAFVVDARIVISREKKA
jgi:acetyltransferase